MENKKLELSPVQAYTIHSSDDDRRSSNKGCYKNYTTATVKAKGAGWWGSDGEVREILVYTDGDAVYEVKCIGKFTDEAEKYREDLMESIKSKLTPSELEILNIK